MSLPKQLLYANKINASYARNYTSVLQPQNSSNYGLGQTAIFNIPCMSNTALSGADTVFSFKLKIRNASGGAATAHLNRCGSAAVIQRLRLFHGSSLLCDIDNYSQLASLMTTHQQSRDDVRGKSQVLQGTNELRGDTIMDAVATATNVTRDFAFPLMSILSMTDNYVPLWAMTGSSLRLEIQFVSAITKFVGASAALTNHTDGVNTLFSDCKLHANIVEMSDDAMQIIQSSLQGRPVEWVCQSYSNYVFNSNLGTGLTQLSVPVAAKYNSLKALYACVRRYSEGATDVFSDDSPSFALAEYSARIGAKVIPNEKPTTIPQFLAEVERALGSVSNTLKPHSYTYAQIVSVAAADLAVSRAFMVGIELESYSNTDMSGKVYQGLNTSTDDIFLNLSFAGQAGAIAVRVDTFAAYDQLISIDNGMVTVRF